MTRTAISWKRLGTDALVLILALIAPWWVSCIAACIAAFFFKKYLELIALGLILDWLYNAPTAWFGGFQYALSAGAIISFLLISYLNTFLRF